MNLLVEKAPDYIVVGGDKIKINTSFDIWIDFIIHLGSKEDEKALNVLLTEIFIDGCPNTDLTETVKACFVWMFPPDDCRCEGNFSSNKTGAQAFDFVMDGNVIYCELWEYFPHLMEHGITFHEGMQLIKLLLSNENTMLWHRAFARCGDFSKMDKEQKKYWQQERARWAIKKTQADIDDVFSAAF